MRTQPRIWLMWRVSSRSPLPPPISTSSFCSLCVVAAKHLRAVHTSGVQRMCSSLLCPVLRSTTNAFSQTVAAAVASHLSNTNTTYNICFLIGQHKNNTLLHDCLPNTAVCRSNVVTCVYFIRSGTRRSVIVVFLTLKNPKDFDECVDS